MDDLIVDTLESSLGSSTGQHISEIDPLDPDIEDDDASDHRCKECGKLYKQMSALMQHQVWYQCGISATEIKELKEFWLDTGEVSNVQLDSNNSSSIIDTSIAVNADTEKMSTAVNADNGEKDNHREAPEILAGDGPDECILAQFDGISQALRNADHNNSSSIITATVDPDGCILVDTK